MCRDRRFASTAVPAAGRPRRPARCGLTIERQWVHNLPVGVWNWTPCWAWRARLSLATPLRRCAFCPLEMLDEQGQRPIEDGSRIAVRNDVAEQVLRAPQLRVRLRGNRHLDLIPSRRKRTNNWRTHRCGAKLLRRFLRSQSRLLAAGIGRSQTQWLAHRRRRRSLRRGRPRRGEPAHRRAHVGSRMQARDDFLDRALALVPRRVEDFAMVRLGEVRAQQADGGQGQLAIAQPLQHQRKPLRRSRRLDAMVGRVLGVVQALRAVREQRRVSLGEVEPAGVEFRKRSEKGGGRLPLALCKATDFRNQVVIGQLRDGGGSAVHALNIGGRFSTRPAAVVLARSTHESRRALSDDSIASHGRSSSALDPLCRPVRTKVEVAPRSCQGLRGVYFAG